MFVYIFVVRVEKQDFLTVHLPFPLQTSPCFLPYELLYFYMKQSSPSHLTVSSFRNDEATMEWTPRLNDIVCFYMNVLSVIVIFQRIERDGTVPDKGNSLWNGEAASRWGIV